MMAIFPMAVQIIGSPVNSSLKFCASPHWATLVETRKQLAVPDTNVAERLVAELECSSGTQGTLMK